MIEFRSTSSIPFVLEREIEKWGSYIDNDTVNSKPSTKRCKELLGYQFRINGWADRDTMLEMNGLSKEFCIADFNDRIGFTPVNPGSAIDLDVSKALAPHLNEEGKLDYTYSERLYYQWAEIVHALKYHKDTRQAYMAVWNPNIDVHGIGQVRVPCSIGYHFLLRDGKLNMIYSMRSLEVTKCLGNDIYTASLTLEYVAEKVGVKCGWIQFNIGSMHIFE